MKQFDLIFNSRSLTLGGYFAIGVVLSGLWGISGNFLKGNDLFFLPLALLVILLWWLIWIGPRYLRQYNRKHVLLFGVLAFFAPTIIHACMLWLGQPGWPLDNFMGRPYFDYGALLSVFIFVGVVYGLLLLRLKVYDAVDARKQRK
jgi:hypothetical protein